MPKKFRSWRRAERRGHLTLHVYRDSNNIVHSQLVHTQRRFGPANPHLVYMHLNSVKGDAHLDPKK